MKFFLTFILLICTNSCFGWSFFRNRFTPQIDKPKKQDPILPSFMEHTNPIIIFLDPMGDLQNPGREIDGTFERGVALQFAQALKSLMERECTNLKILLTKSAGESNDFLTNASLANQLNVDLYINLNFYHETSPKSCISTYYLLYNPTTDLWKKRNQALSLIPFDLAYLNSLDKTVKYTHIFTQNLKELANGSYVAFDALGIPFKPLRGIISPAFAIELGIRKNNEWRDLVNPIKSSLQEIIKLIIKNKVHD